MRTRQVIRRSVAATTIANSQNKQWIGTVVSADPAGGICLVNVRGNILQCVVPAGTPVAYDSKVSVGRVPGSDRLVVNGGGGATTQIIMAGEAAATAPAAQPPLIPTTPVDLVATALSSTSIFLEWSSTGEDTDLFKVERSLDGGNFAEIAQVPVSQTTYTDTGLTNQPGTGIASRRRTMADSEYSNIADATTLVMVPATGILDDFNRTDEPNAPPTGWSDVWEYVLGLSVLDGECTPEAPEWGGGGNRWDEEFDENQEAYLTLTKQHAPLGDVIIHLRAVGAEFEESYAASFNWDIGTQSSVSITRWVSGVPDVLIGVNLPAGFDFGVGDKFWFRSMNDVLMAYYQVGGAGDWVEAASVVDATLSGPGYIAVYMSGGDLPGETAIDDFGGGSL